MLMPVFAASLLGGVAAPVSAHQPVAVAATPAKVSFNIPADRLDHVLIAIAKSVGGIILFDPALTGALRSPGVQGSFTVQDALREAMKGSDLEARANPDGSFGVHRVAAKAATPAAPESPAASASSLELAPSVLPTVVISNNSDVQTSHGYNDIGFVTRTTRSATRTDTPLSEIPQSVQGVTADLLERQQAQSVVDALRNASSVAFERGSGVDQAGTLYVRGFVAPVMKNGVADLVSLTNVTNGRVAGSRSITSLDTPIAAIERVEVLGGADSIIAGGPMEPGGVVNILTKRPQADAVRELTLEIGNDGHRRTALDLAGSLSADQIWTYRTVVSATHDARTFDGYDGAREFYLAPSIGYRHDGTSLVAGASHQLARAPFGGYQNAQLTDQGPGPNIRTSPWGRADDHSYAAKTEVFYDLEQRLGEGWAFLSKAQFAKLRYDSTGYVSCLPSDLGATTGVCLPDQSTLTSYSRYMEASVRGKFQTGSLQHTMLVGMSYRQTRLGSYNDLDSPDAVDVPWPPSGMQLPPVTGAKSLIATDDTIYSSNVFLQDQMTWRRWHMLVNVGYEQERNNFSLDVDRNGVERDTSPPRNSPVYNLGIAYRLGERATLYANAFRSFTPGNRVLDATLNGGPPGTIVAPPTTGKSVEIGLKLNLLDNRATFSAALYRATHTNVLQPTSVQQTTSSFVDYVLLPSTISRGVELNIAGRLMAGWNLTASYSYIAFQYAKPPGEDPQLSQFPRHRASLWSTYDFQAEGWRGWGVGLGLTMRSGYQAFSETDTLVRLAGQTRTDASIYYRSRHGRTTLGIKNLFNRRLYSDFSASTVGVEPRRTLLLTNISEF
ncbi:TonB-dependent siderophore receptor [Herbaspirillum sp. CF444]|uniref:TonB-dependent siderophore receptor n=1 Tax=Herbaspirillum sp. CF444 TaxID=1144319 RepID=UPI000272465A|nr:TonB-dependent receptor [Herbaspirillum sp. CF444]EJL84977.1 TonB-dependent siderophore receptor [Herbaspirillum sp. CF444]